MYLYGFDIGGTKCAVILAKVEGDQVDFLERFGANEGSCVGVGNAVAEDGNNIVAAGLDKSDAVIQLIKDGALICTMAQNPDVMGYEGMYAAITAINDGQVAPEYIDTGVSILNLDAVK